MDTAAACGTFWCPRRRRQQQQQQRTFRLTVDQQSSLLFQQYTPDVPDLAEFGVPLLPPAVTDARDRLYSRTGRDVTVSLSHDKTHMIMRTDANMHAVPLAAVHAELGGPAHSCRTDWGFWFLPEKMIADAREFRRGAAPAAGRSLGKRCSGKSTAHGVLICGDLYQAKSRKEARSFVQFISRAERELMQRALEGIGG